MFLCVGGRVASLNEFVGKSLAGSLRIKNKSSVWVCVCGSIKYLRSIQG